MNDLDLSDPDTYRDGPPHAYFTELRATDPVHWQPMPGSGRGGYWAVLKHRDVETVARQPLLFSSAERGVVLEDLEGERLEQMRGMLLAMDPPKHRQVRKPLTPRMTPRALSGLADGIRAICNDIFDEAAQAAEVEFVDDVAAALPTRVVGALMGLPREDWVRVHKLAEAITHGQDPDYVSEGGSAADASTEMGMYGYQFAVDRAAREPVGDGDITDALLAVMDPVAFAMLFIQLVTAGQDTTQTMLSSGLLALLDHPDQLALLRAEPSRIPAAIEEIVRWANPLHYFRRTATEDTVIGDTKIAAGDAVAMYYSSCNRDEAVFADSQAFDITRTPNKHLGFGQAEHFCVGVHLARLEGRIFYEELLARFTGIELAGVPQRLRSNLNNSYKSVPVTLTPA
ncbi:MAG TPA: cytochrome P450 [Mycobacteriales bacterium]|nr:cytochrome P450 [Mycobacteriales bacterium]